MAVNWRIATMILVDLALLMCLIASYYRERRQKYTKAPAGPISLLASDRGHGARRSLTHLLAPSAADCQTEISPEIGAYVLGTNPLGVFFPRYIYFRDGSANGLKLAVIVRSDGTIQMSVLKGSVRYGGLVYHEDKRRILTIRKGESIWLGQSEIKVR